MGRSAQRKKTRDAPRPAEEPGPEPTRDWRRLLLPGLALFVFTALVYAPVRRAEFVNYDDYLYVVENSHVATGLTSANVAWAFTHFAAGNWHPLTWISHQADCQLYGLQPAGHHVTSVLIHAANAVLLLGVLFAMTGALWRSLLVAALFAVHPLNVESVAWISERKNVLSTLFWLLAMGAHARYARRPSPGRYALVALLLALGLMSKPMVVTLPCALLLLDWWPLGRWSPRQPNATAGALALVREKLPLFALVLIGSLVAVAAQRQAQAVPTLGQVPFTARLTNATVAYAAYLEQTVWPSGLAAFYPHLVRHLPVGRVLLALLLLGALTALAWRLRDAAYLPVGWLWYLGTLVPVIGIVQVGSQARADRYAYVPLLGIFIALAWGLEALTRGSRLAGAGAALAVAALASITVRQAGYWQNSMALFEHARDVTPDNYVAYTNLGLAYNKQKRWDEAIRHFDRALQIQPRSAEAWGHRGLALAKEGRLDEAVQSLQRALDIYPSVLAHNSLGIALGKRDPDAAIGHLRAALDLDPEFVEARINLGSALLHKGDAAGAQQAFDEALRRDPQSAITHFRLGSVLLEHGELDGAALQLGTALRLDPTQADTHNSLGVVRLRRGDLDAALALFREALAIEPLHADAHSNVGVVLLRKGQKEAAQAELAAALRLNPRHADAHATLGAMLAQDGKLEEGTTHFRAAVEADPDNAIAQNNLGAALLQKGDLDGAVEHLTRAIRANPRHADAHSNLGVALLQQGRREAAIDHLETALRLSPGHRNAEAYLLQARGRGKGVSR